MRAFRSALVVLAAVGLASADDWSFTRQVYSFETQGMTYQELASAGVTYVTHVAPTPQVAAEAHRWGIKTMPYVSLYKVIDTSLEPAYAKQPFWRQLDLVQHPDWVLYRPDGKRRIPFDDPNYPRGIFQSCCNQPGIADAYVKGVEEVIQSGADGVFVDNVHPYPRCYGPDLGLHQHLDPTKDNTAMYKVALRRVYEAVKAHGPEFAAMLNSGGPNHAYIGYGDSLMWESWVYRWPESSWTGDRARQCRMHDWKAVIGAEKDWREFTAGGGSIAPLTYLPIPELEQAHAYLAYVCAKLCAFQQWTCAVTERQDTVRQLYRTALGRPVGPLEQAGAVYYRRYEQGLVAGNSGREPVRANLPWSLPQQQVADQYTGAVLPVREGSFAAELPPDSGRVYVTRAAYLANLLTDAAGMAQSCALRLEQEGGDEPQAAKCRLADRQARDCAGAVSKLGEATPPELIDRVCALPTLLDFLVEAPATDRVLEARLMKGEALVTQELPAMLAVKGQTPFDARVSPEGVVLTAGGARFSFRNEGDGVTFRLGPNAMTLWAGPATHADERWLHARRLRDITLVTDTPTEKTAQFVVQLYGRNTGHDISDCDALVTATIRAGIPGIRMSTALRNHTDKPVPAYWFWNIGGRCHTTPTGAVVEPGNPAMVKQAGWYYNHEQQDGGGGLLLVDWTNLGHGYLFAQPKNQTIPAGGTMPINWTAYVVQGAAARDRFLPQRVRWYRQAASLAAGVVGGVQLRLEAPPQGVAGVPASVSLVVSGTEAGTLADLRLALDAQAGTTALVVRPTPDRPGTFTVELPATVTPKQRVDLTGRLTARTARGPLSLVSSESLRVKPALELHDVRQAPADGNAVALSVVLRNNLPTPLPVKLQLVVAGREAPATATATLPVGTEGSAVTVTAPAPGLSAAGGTRLKTRLTVTYEVATGKPLTLTDEREVALTPQTSCQTAANPPIIDGELDDSGWTFATRLAGFVDHLTGQPAREQTVCQLMYDDANLYLGFVCSQADMKHLREQARPDAQGLNPNTPADDSIEVYLAPHPPDPAHFRLCLNALGAAKCDTARGGWTAACTKAADRWTIEVKLPFQVIGATPRTGDVWGFNACRNNQTVNESTSWSWTQGPYANPARFGGLKFTTGGH